MSIDSESEEEGSKAAYAATKGRTGIKRKFQDFEPTKSKIKRRKKRGELW